MKTEVEVKAQGPAASDEVEDRKKLLGFMFLLTVFTVWILS